MNSLRLLSSQAMSSLLPCCLCSVPERCWDQIAGQSYCPQCEEALVLGEGPPLRLATEPSLCAICGQRGTVRYLTYPQKSPVPLEVDLCPRHLRALLGRWLQPPAYRRLKRMLLELDLQPNRVFLLHDAFYDESGVAIQPALDPE